MHAYLYLQEKEDKRWSAYNYPKKNKAYKDYGYSWKQPKKKSETSLQLDKPKLQDAELLLFDKRLPDTSFFYNNFPHFNTRL